MSGVVIANSKVYLSYKKIQELGISEKTFSKWKSRPETKATILDNLTYIEFSSIPIQSRKKLPPEHVLRQIHKNQSRETLADQILKQLELAIHFNTPRHRNYYAPKYPLSADKITLFARKHAVWEKLIELQKGWGWNKAAFEAYINIFPGTRETYNSFCNAFHNAKTNGIETVAIDGRLFKTTLNNVYHERVYYWLRYYAALPKKLTNGQIHSKIIGHCKSESIEKMPGIEWVKKQRRKLLKSNHEIYESRYGSLEAKKREPYAKIIPARHALSQVQIDGFTVPVYYDNDKSTWNKLILFVVLDSHSQKIVGYSMGEGEDSNLILSGLQDAVRNTGSLSAEIVGDNHSFNKTDESKYFKSALDSYGVRWTVSSNPQYKAILERKFKHINEHYFKNIPGWTGQGVRSKDKEGRPPQEYIDQYQKAGYRLTKDQVKMWVINCLDEYNKTVLKKFGKSPNEMYEQSEKPYAISVNLFERVKLFTKAVRVTVRRGQINIIRSGLKYEFQLNAELIHKYNNHEVLVRYEDLNQSIYLFDVKDNPLGEVKPKTGIHGAFVDQDETDRMNLLKNKGRIKGFKTKARKENEALTHPDAYLDMNPVKTSKDIIREFEENAHLRRRAEDNDIDLRYVTVGNEVDEQPLLSLKPQTKLANPSPFSLPGKHIPRVIDPNELYD